MRNSLSGEAIHTSSSILSQFTIGNECKNSGISSQRQQGKKSQKSIGVNSSSHPSKHAFSFKKQELKKSDVSPSISEISHHNDDYYRELQQSLMGENQNLKDHNAFLVSQIKNLFEREKKYKKCMMISKEKIKKLQNLNQHLQNQLMILTNSIVEEIERMQKLIQLDRSIFEDDLKNSVGSDLPKILEGLGEQTQATLNHNLEELKVRVNNICNENISRVTTECHNFFNYQEGTFDSHDKMENRENNESLGSSPAIFRDFSQGFLRKSQDMDQPTNLPSERTENKRLPPKKR